MSTRKYRHTPLSSSSPPGRRVRHTPLTTTQEYQGGTRTACPSTPVAAVLTLAVCAFFLGGITLGYYIRHVNFENRIATATDSGEEGEDQWSPVNVQARHKSFFQGEQGVLEILKNQLWLSVSGLSPLQSKLDTLTGLLKTRLSNYTDVEEINYSHRTTSPDALVPNNLRLVDGNGTVLTDANFILPGDSRERTHQPHVSGSAAGYVRGEIVYMNEGFLSDFHHVIKHRIPLQGRIALIRLSSEINVIQQVTEAETHNMSAVLLYHVPQNYSENGTSCTDHTPYINTQFTVDTSKTRQLSVHMFRIPVQTISCRFAMEIHERLEGRKVPASWNPIPPVQYIGRTSIKSVPWEAELLVNNKPTTEISKTIIGTIKGRDDPEHLVLVGSTRFVSSTAGLRHAMKNALVLLEVAQKFNYMIEVSRWLPKRTIKICLWGSELAMAQYFQDNRELLENKVVSYIDVDQHHWGNYSLDVDATRAVAGSVRAAAKLVPDPQYAGETLYDSWSYASWNVESEDGEETLVVDPPLRTQSLFYSQGFPYAHLRYTGQANFGVANVQQPEMGDERGLEEPTSVDLGYLRTLSHIIGVSTLKMSDLQIINYDLTKFAVDLHRRASDQAFKFSFVISSNLYDSVTDSSSYLKASVKVFEQYLTEQFDWANSVALRKLNEKLLHFGSVSLRVQRILLDLKKLKENDASHHAEATSLIRDVEYYVKVLPRILMTDL